ncbi:glycoside hydrolase family 28 protein [Aquimarina sp. BL5]|uniref:glycoside hydrolase family 28 protein n=1 Tax=Aquimarina sp. BL5 TaxID=1714860 RepID=UPI000E47C4D9|nr:glycosyl hydrolase family 28 protein [Aquimarina sp. BL5]AXT50226.1 glycoside hydrolase family 28 protein [Aquimarina sp. BL5]RKN09543.1 glycoside hydrolase family 28 protein [Aquimarina sp. BL5]
MKKIALLILIILLISCKSSSNKVYNVTDFGAKGDSLTLNTKFIQKAIDKCSQNGGGKVIVNKGIYISGTILLKNNVTLHVSQDTKLVGSSNPQDYKSTDAFTDATGQERGNCLIGATDAANIGISGKGIIDGNGKAFLYKNIQQKIKELNIDKNEEKKFGRNRPFLIRFVRSNNINLTNINLRQPAAWTCHFYQSNTIKVDDISIYSHANHNNDGVDLDSSFDIKITNSKIDTGDDSICIKTTSPKPTYNVFVKNCELKSDWGAIKFGTESMGDFYNINIKDCKIYDTKGGGIKLLSVDGANINDITIDNIEMENVDMPIFIRLGERLRTYRNAEKQSVGSINNINIKNIRATTRSLDSSRVSSPSGIFITGTENHKIESVLLENIEITLPGSEKNLVLKPVEENEKEYPEFSFFKVLPAYGLYGRHIENLKLKNVKFNITASDIREEIILEDVTKKTTH